MWGHRVLQSLGEVKFELRPELSEGAIHVAVSENAGSKALGQASAWPHVFSGLQEFQSPGVVEPERLVKSCQTLRALVVTWGFILSLFSDLGGSNEDLSLGFGIVLGATVAVRGLAVD